MADFLLELLSEEIPARMQAAARGNLKLLFGKALAESGIFGIATEEYSTPRRLVLIARGLPQETAATSEELKGPRTSAPPQALEGFLRKTGLNQDQLTDRDGIWFAILERPGRATLEVLAEAIPAIVRAFPWPKSMRWGAASLSTESQRWVRPLQGIVAMLDETVVDFEIGDVRSGAATIGHRFHHPGRITLGGASDYLEKLRACHVIVDQDERARIVCKGAAAAAAHTGLALVQDDGLVAENAGLTEWPVPLLGTFDPDFLQVPREVIQLTMRTNQRYFAATDTQGELAPAFICVTNIDAADGGEAIVRGNQKVLAARLADARFFWEQDLKIELQDQAAKLDQILFHEQLGTIAQKVERVAKLAVWLIKKGAVGALAPEGPVQLAELADRAARLCKADLVTQMVGEFPELQGLIGGYIAAAQGEPPQVADAIRDHYKPAGQGDAVPTAPVTVAVSLADKLDNLLSFFRIGMFPTGSKDPFALRRAALGYLRLVQSNKIRLVLSEVSSNWQGGDASLGRRLADFLHDRLGVQLRETGVRYDFVQASTSWGTGTDDRLDRVEARARALAGFLTSSVGIDLLAGYKRASNILKKENWEAEGGESSCPDYTREPAEAALIAALKSAEQEAAAATAREDFEGAMRVLATLRGPVDSFFDEVTVNDPDDEKRKFRLDLLARLQSAVHRVADFSKIEGVSG